MRRDQVSGVVSGAHGEEEGLRMTAAYVKGLSGQYANPA